MSLNYKSNDKTSKPENLEQSDKLSQSKLVAYVFLWLTLNAILIWIGVESFSFMFEKGNFYGKGSTGILIGILFGMYKVHIRYFNFVIILFNKLKGSS